MKFKLGIFQIFFVSLMIQSLSLADQTFRQPPEVIPTEIKGPWDSTFLLVSSDKDQFMVGTAVVNRVDSSSKKTSLFFLTNSHLLVGNCKLNKKCPDLLLIQDARLLPDKKDFDNIKKLSSGLYLDSVQIVKRDQIHDLALLKAEIQVKKSTVLPTPVEIANSCESSKEKKSVTIGFPHTAPLKVDPAHPIADQPYLRKRWNNGFYYSHVTTLEGSKYGATTNLTLHGSSGGPVLDSEGRMLGLMESGTADETNNYAYTGSEGPKTWDWSSSFILCTDIRNFLK